MKKLVLFLVLAFTLIGCVNVGVSKDGEIGTTYTGEVEYIGMTTFQYGTHLLTTDSKVFFALKSDEIELDDYVGKQVQLMGDPIVGYPVDDGPTYLNVTEIKVIE